MLPGLAAPYAVTIGLSCLRSRLLRTLLLLAVLSLLDSTLPDNLLLAAVLGAIAGVRRALHHKQSCQLSRGVPAQDDDSHKTWRLLRGGQTVCGRLHREGYHSAWLVVIVLETRDGRRVRVPVWRDSVEAVSYAWLSWHRQLAARGVTVD